MRILGYVFVSLVAVVAGLTLIGRLFGSADRDYCDMASYFVKQVVIARSGADPSAYRRAGDCTVTGQGHRREVYFGYSSPRGRQLNQPPMRYRAVVAKHPDKDNYVLCSAQFVTGGHKRVPPNEHWLCQ
jgi:hypothetical protein